MKIKRESGFKNSQNAIDYFNSWVDQLEKNNNRQYERIEVQTSLGKTHIWGINTDKTDLEALVIFPGARTTTLFWDFDRGLDNLKHDFRIFMVETNGLPNLSDGKSPDIKSLDYGHWANEVLNKLGITNAFVAGASFGGLICMKLAITNPEKINATFLLNPGCLQPFSMSIENLYYNILPLIKPTEINVSKFLNKAIFSKPNHKVSVEAEKLLLEYELFTIRDYNDNTQKPYYMNAELAKVESDTFLLLGDKDLLFPHQKSIKNAQKHIQNLKDVKVFNNVGHGIETYATALNYIGETCKRLNLKAHSQSR